MSRDTANLASIHDQILAIREDLAVITMAILSERVIAAGVSFEEVPSMTANLYWDYLQRVKAIRDRPEPPTEGDKMPSPGF
jgi:hypothetical protein